MRFRISKEETLKDTPCCAYRSRNIFAWFVVGKSNRFPISGQPFGPGGRGSDCFLSSFNLYFTMRMNATTATSGSRDKGMMSDWRYVEEFAQESTYLGY